MLAKRCVDIVLSSVGLLFLLPIFLWIMVKIKFDSTGNVFFRQQRVGRHGKLFDILKFRTMVDKQSGLQLTTGDDPRITVIGAFLRKYKLDELPQLINVLRGEMSLVGPRPEVAEFVAYYPKEVRQLILSVLPGMTDDTAIKFSDENSLLSNAENPKEVYIQEILPRKLKMYEAYVTTQNFFRDMQLIFLTLKKIIYGVSH